MIAAATTTSVNTFGMPRRTRPNFDNTSAILLGLGASRLARSLVSSEHQALPCLGFLEAAASLARSHAPSRTIPFGNMNNNNKEEEVEHILPKREHIASVIAFTLTQVSNAYQPSHHHSSSSSSSLFDFKNGRRASVTLETYLSRCIVHTLAQSEVFIIALAFIDRLAINIPLSPSNVHRLWFCAFVLASKFYDDFFHSNLHYSKVAGIPVEELNNLEAEFLSALGFRLFMNEQEWKPYYIAAEQLSWVAASGGIQDLFVQLASNTANPLLLHLNIPIASSSTTSPTLTLNQTNQQQNNNNNNNQRKLSPETSPSSSPPTKTIALTPPPNTSNSQTHQQQAANQFRWLLGPIVNTK